MAWVVAMWGRDQVLLATLLGSSIPHDRGPQTPGVVSGDGEGRHDER
jgi:hypothetical protein